MTFVLNHAGHGCYALAFRGEHIGSVFAADEERDEPWIATIHDVWAARMAALPAPFAATQHRFRTLRDVRRWLANAGHRGTISSIAGHAAAEPIAASCNVCG